MNILFLLDRYADTLLALGICAAYGVEPNYHGGAYRFPDAPAHDTAPFPQVAEEGEDPEPPYTFHRFKMAAVNAFGGRSLLTNLSDQWNALLPDYHEIWPLLPPNSPDFKTTRFWKVSMRYSGAATFRPAASKDPLTEQTLKDFWLFDALRAIGFVTYAAPKLLRRETQTARWVVFAPALPSVSFQDGMLHQPDLEINLRCQLMAHLIASELNIPRLECVKYAELNPLARTPMQLFSLEPRRLDFAIIQELKRVVYHIGSVKLPEQQRYAERLLDVLERQDPKALMNFNVSGWETNKRGTFLNLNTEVISALLTSDRIVSA